MADKPSEENQLRVVSSGGHIRLEPAKSSRRSKKTSQHLVLSVAQDISPFSGFLDFLKQYSVAGLIIGFVLGGQVQSLVKQLVQSFLDPLTVLLFGTALSDKSLTLRLNGRSAQFAWGAFVYAIIIFLLVMFAMYAAFKLLKLDKLSKDSESKK